MSDKPETAQEEAQRTQREFKEWRQWRKVEPGGHCPSCGRFHVALWRNRYTCPWCLWCETD